MTPTESTELGAKIYGKAFIHFEALEREALPNQYISELFLSCEELEKKHPHVVPRAKQIHHYVVEQLNRSGRGTCASLFSTHFPIPKRSLKHLLGDPDPVMSTQTDENKDAEGWHEDLDSFVTSFNQNRFSRDRHRQMAIDLLNRLHTLARESDGQLRSKEVPSAREGLFILYQCHDSDIKERALLQLTELLEGDPLSSIKTASDLVTLQKQLLEEIQANKAQNLHTHLQRHLIKAFAVTLESILLHAALSHLNGLTEEVRKQIWDGAKELSSYNTTKDPIIKFWADYAEQAAQRIQTNQTDPKRWMHRVVKIIRHSITLAGLSFGISQPGDAGEVAEGICADLLDMYSHIEWREKWFEDLLIMKRLARYSLHDSDLFRKVIDLIQKRKYDETKPELRHGIIFLLDYIVMRSPVSEVQEESIKQLIQFVTLDEHQIRAQVVLSLLHMLQDDKHLRRRNTAYVVLKLLEASGKICLTHSIEEVEVIPHLAHEVRHEIERFEKRGTAIGGKELYSTVVNFLLRRVGDIKEERDYGGQSFVTLLSLAANEKLIPALFKCLAKLSPKFQDPDFHGKTPYHLATENNNLEMIRQIHADMHGIDLNFREYQNHNTALHIAVEMCCEEAVELLLKLGANPNIRNKEGNTALHLASEKGQICMINKVISADSSLVNNEGKTALNIAISKDHLQAVALLLEAKATIAEHVHGITPIVLAARLKSESTLKYLIENKTDLTSLEAFEVMRMISSDRSVIRASPDFCHFHLERLEKNESYARMCSYSNWVRIRKSGEQGFSALPGFRRQETLLPQNDQQQLIINRHRTVLEEQFEPIHDFGNHLLIRLAKKKELMTALKECLAHPIEVNQANYFGITALHTAVIFHNLEAATLLLDAKADVNFPDIRGFTPLHLAAHFRDLAMITLLLSKKGDPNAVNEYGDTPFLIACGNFPSRTAETLFSVLGNGTPREPNGENKAIIELFLNNNAELLAKDRMGNNALHHAALYGPLETIHIFIQNDTLFWEKNQQGLLPFELALQNKREFQANLFKGIVEQTGLKKLHSDFVEKTGNKLTFGNMLVLSNGTEILEALIKETPAFAEEEDSTPMTFSPLLVAAQHDKVDVLKLYIKLGRTSKRDAFGNSAAHLAAAHNHIEFLSELKNSGLALRDLRNRDGRTPLHVAAALGKDAIIALLLQEEGITTKVDGQGNTALHLACRHGKLEAVKTLSKIEPKLLAVANDDGNTPLHIAAANGHLQVVEHLVTLKASLETRNIFDATVLTLAAQQGHQPIVKFLIQKEADIRALDEEGESPLHKAVFHHHVEIVKLLLERDKKLVASPEKTLVNIIDKSHETAIHELMKKNRAPAAEILRLLLDANASLEDRNEQGETFLHLACLRGRDDILKVVFDYFHKHISLTVVDHQKNSLLHKACEGNFPATVAYLARMKVDINPENKEGFTPLLTAVKRGFCDLAEDLISRGAHTKATNKKKRNIIHLLLERAPLTERELTFIQEMITRYPFLIDGKDSHKKTALHILAENNHLAALDILLRRLPGSQKTREEYVSLKNSDGKTAQDIACEKKFPELEKRLRNYLKDDLGADYTPKRRWYQIK